MLTLPAPATAVAYAGDRIVAQTREPAAIYIMDSVFSAQGRERIEILLGGRSMFDTGHEIFHRDAGAGVACASLGGVHQSAERLTGLEAWMNAIAVNAGAPRRAGLGAVAARR